MDASNYITQVTSEFAILRYLNGISEQGLPLYLSPAGTSGLRKYSSKIVRVDEENHQLVLHQPAPADWRNRIQPSDNIEIICHIQQGTIKFEGKLSPLDESGNSMYYRLPFPEQISKKQLRSTFRVSVLKFSSIVVLDDSENSTIQGTCRDISEAGALIELPATACQNLKSGHTKHCHIVIPDFLDIACTAELCRVAKPAADRANALIGLSFLDVERDLRRDIKAAIVKIERSNIKQ